MRKSHTKSRHGCLSCKKRHIKCDETHPKCVSCTISNLACLYPQKLHTVSPAAYTSVSPAAKFTESRISKVTATTNGTPSFHGDFSTTSFMSNQACTFVQFELLHHFSTVTYETLTHEKAHQLAWQRTAINLGLAHPFLMYEILGIAALHKAYCDPLRSEYYTTKATQLQSLAMQGFNAMQQTIDAANCGAIFLFTSLLAIHVLADSSYSRGASDADRSSEYIDRMVSCLSLINGARSLIMDDWYPILREGELKPFFDLDMPEEPFKDIPEEVRNLSQLVKIQAMTEETAAIYDRTINRLQWNFALSHIPAQRHSTVRFLLAWPIQLSSEYLELLNQRRPEALIILAYFGVMLCYYRDSWAVGASGANLVAAINKHLGPYWSQYLEWPMTVV